MKNKIYLSVYLISFCLFSSCCTIINGSRETVSFRSNPPSAVITINDKVYGKTPLSIQLKRKKKIRNVKLSLPGYETYEVEMKRQLDGLVGLNIMNGVIIGLSIDAITGSMYHTKPEVINVDLKVNH